MCIKGLGSVAHPPVDGGCNGCSVKAGSTDNNCRRTSRLKEFNNHLSDMPLLALLLPCL